jgi:hypothetical protein
MCKGAGRRGLRPYSAASAATHLSPVPHQIRNFLDTLIWSFFVWSLFAPDNGNNLIQQVCLDWMFCARLVDLDQRSSEPIEGPDRWAPLRLWFCTKHGSGVTRRSLRVDLSTFIGSSFALHVTPPRIRICFK